MAETKDIGRFFWQLVKVRRTARPFAIVPSVEIEHPFRRSRCVVFHLPGLSTGLVLGWWRNTGWDEETALMEAVSGWGIDPYDESFESADTKRAIRENVAASGMDLDDEWQIISMLGAEV